MKKLSALFLAVTLLLVLCACNKKPADPTGTLPTRSDKPILSAPTEPQVTDPEPTVPTEPAPTYPNDHFDPRICASIFGTWKTPIVLDGSLMNMPEFEGSVSFDFLFTFQRTGYYTVSADMDTVTKAIAEYETMLTNYMLEGFHSKFVAEGKLQGKSETQIETEWTTEESLLAQARAEAFVAGIGLTERFSSVVRCGDYYADASTVYLSTESGEYETHTFKLSNQMLYFYDCSNAADYTSLRLKFPLTLWPEGVAYEELDPEPIEPLPTEPVPTVPVPPLQEPTEPKPTEPKPTEPTPTVPDPTEPTPTVPKPTEPTPTVPKPTEPTPTVPKPTEPTPTVPKPTEPTPTVPDPTEPEPTEPEPTEPEPTEPEPTEPEPTEPEPTEPEPTEPEPTEPEPTEPEPTEPEPTEPEPTEPEPTEPDPTEPEPTEPEPAVPDITE